jgi:hypothetical protein
VCNLRRNLVQNHRCGRALNQRLNPVPNLP